ncbi:MAG TPA: NAD(P)-dependent alcohol dehydrogenase [Actinomycetota bacterium]|jgi:NADPH:quinone reductase-like Zn-dependent oxidoreductase|nr:NAD(P)-dependent alcohol dehydrogenase [Actinomycetota bacterium]
MQAITYHRYGAPEVLQLEEVEQPVPGDGEVLVRVHAASVNPRDWHFLRGLPYVLRPLALRVPTDGGLGSDVAGRVEAAGRGVTRFRPGDEVYGYVQRGAFAEFASVPERVLGPKPANLSFEQAAAVPLAAMTALQGLRDHGRVRAGERVLVVGASGGVGTFVVQLAKLLGAEVTGVCSTRNLELVRSLGADHVVDYTREDFAGNGRRYDLILQLAGTRTPADCRRALTPTGRLLLSSGEGPGRWIGPLGRMARAVVLSPFVSQRLGAFEAKPSGADLRALAELIEAGKVVPVIDRTYPLVETPAALGYLETGHARGKVVITV